MQFQPCKYIYDDIYSGDVFFSHGCTFIGDTIRLFETNTFHFTDCDLTIPDHAGFFFEIYGQMFAAEVGINGITIDSIDKVYTKANNQIISVLHWNFLPVNDFNIYMAYWIRKRMEEGYDIIGAISSVKFFQWLGLKPDSTKEFCSKDVFSVLKYLRQSFPGEWDKQAPDPLRLYNYLVGCSKWKALPVNCWKKAA